MELNEVSRRALLGGGLVGAGALGASAIWATENGQTDSHAAAQTGRSGAIVPQLSLRTWDVGTIGDSITSNGLASGLSGERGSGMCVFSEFSYLGAALPLTNGRFRFGGCWATPTYTTDLILADHLNSAVAARPAVCVILAGTNDVGRYPLDHSRRNITAMVTALQRAGTLPVLATIPPFDGQSATTDQRLLALNVWLRSYARSAGLPLADFHAVLADPATGGYLAGHTIEGVHPNGAGAALMGRELAATLNAIAGATATPLLSSFTPHGALLADVCQTGTSAWLATPAAAGRYVRVTGPGWRGNKGVITTRGSAPYSLAARLSAKPGTGHRVQLAFVLDAATVPAGGKWSCLLADAVSQSAVCGYFECTQPLTNPAGNPVSLWEFDLPAGRTDAKYEFIYSVSGADGTSLGCAQVSVVDLTALGAT